MEAIGIPIPSGLDRSASPAPASPGGGGQQQQSQSFSGRGFTLGSLMRRPRSGTTGSNLGASAGSTDASGGGRGSSMLRTLSTKREDASGDGPSRGQSGGSLARGRSHSLSAQNNNSASAVSSSRPPVMPLSAGLPPTEHSPHHSRANSAPDSPSMRPADAPLLAASSSHQAPAQAQSGAGSGPDAQQQQRKPYHIRLVPHLELSSRSLHFEPTSRSLRPGHTLKIGRFNERSVSHSQATNANATECSRVAFKSKVVSRQHAEFFLEAKEDGSPGALWVKDTKSSSGSFLNHIRLSGPGLESRLFQVRDGDVFQLGVDYQGGTEEMYRCVKMRVEINRHVQKGASQFNVQALKRALGNAGAALPGPETTQDSGSLSNKSSKPPQPAPTESTDCCICLFAVSVCQALFIAPCSHVYHYKCIRPLLQMHHPGFSCPLCRTFADLDADVDDDQLLGEGLDGSDSSEEDALPTSTTEGNILQLSEQQNRSASGLLDVEDPQMTMAHAPSGAQSVHSRRSSLHSRRHHGSSSHLSSMHGSTVPDAGDFEAEMRRASLSVAGPHGHSAALGHIAVTGRSSRPGSVRNLDLGSQTPNSERRSLIHLPSMDEIAAPLLGSPSPREEGAPPENVASGEDEGGALSRVRTYVEPDRSAQQ